MSEEDRGQVSHLGHASDRPQTVLERILRRKAVLNQWLREGVPAHKMASIPRSLREARDWDDPELGIVPIGSPNDFTKNHVAHGQHVNSIAVLLDDLKRKYSPPDKPARPSRPVADDDRKKLQGALTEAVSQWHAARADGLAERQRADGAEARSTLLLQENAAKDDEIADLRRRLASREGLRVVE
jgi:hypothetical protein